MSGWRKAMTPTRIIGGTGRLLILTGVLVLLFVAYQLWGTGLQHARAQDKLEDQFAELLEQSGATTAPPDDPGDTSDTGDTDGTPSPSTTLPPEDEATDPGNNTPVALEEGDVMARIEMPSIGVDQWVVQGTSVPDLRKGPGHYVDTPAPGEPGNAAIAGHRTTYGAPFGEIAELVPGDQIIVTTLAGRFEYAVLDATEIHPEGDPSSGHLIVEPTDVWVLDDYGDNRLTLTACHPKYSARQRIVVAAELAVPPVEPPPTTIAPDGTGSGAGVVDEAGPDLDEGLGGDPSARTPALLWGLFFFVILAGVWQLSVRWRRWPSYALGAIPLVLVLFVWFENLDRWMPAR